CVCGGGQTGSVHLLQLYCGSCTTHRVSDQITCVNGPSHEEGRVLLQVPAMTGRVHPGNLEDSFFLKTFTVVQLSTPTLHPRLSRPEHPFLQTHRDTRVRDQSLDQSLVHSPVFLLKFLLLMITQTPILG
uniref:Uncharacterized protein n=1 Tax=Cynoglossus semilaevis TaxID=244447 RepID=A0A3P8WXM7_CYNSE